MLHVNTLCIIILKFHKEEINNYYVYHIMSTNNYACWLTLSMSKNPNQFWNLKLSAKYWNRDRKLNLKMLLCIHVHNGTSTLGHLYSWDTSTRRLFSWSWQNSQLRSNKLCIYHLYYKGTSMRRLGHFLSAASAISAPIKGTTTKLPMITMPSETRSCSSFAYLSK